MRERLFTRILFEAFDLSIPFFCHRCGTCCKTYMPGMDYRHLQIICRDMNLVEEDIFSSYAQCRRRYITGHPEPCIFQEENLCMIYNHSLRPDVCYLYPFSYDKPVIVDCPGYDEHQRLIEIFLKGDVSFEIYDSSFCPCLPARSVPAGQWPMIAEMWRSAELSEEKFKEFEAMNRGRLSPEPLWGFQVFLI